MPHALVEALRRGMPHIELVSATSLLDRVRLVKSRVELDRLRRSARICEAGWEAFVRALRPGVHEYEIVAEVEYELKRQGAEDNFMLIASGGDEVTHAGRRCKFYRMAPAGVTLVKTSLNVRELTLGDVTYSRSA